jgi:hypothetical protein
LNEVCDKWKICTGLQSTAKVNFANDDDLTPWSCWRRNKLSIKQPEVNLGGFWSRIFYQEGTQTHFDDFNWLYDVKTNVELHWSSWHELHTAHRIHQSYHGAIARHSRNSTLQFSISVKIGDFVYGILTCALPRNIRTTRITKQNFIFLTSLVGSFTRLKSFWTKRKQGWKQVAEGWSV